MFFTYLTSNSVGRSSLSCGKPGAGGFFSTYFSLPGRFPFRLLLLLPLLNLLHHHHQHHPHPPSLTQQTWKLFPHPKDGGEDECGEDDKELEMGVDWDQKKARRIWPHLPPSSHQLTGLPGGNFSIGFRRRQFT
jgi:hypothetical protein